MQLGEAGVKAWDAIKITGLRTDVDVWLPRVSQWIDGGIEFVESGTKVVLRKGGNDVGEIVNDVLHVKYTGLGGDVVAQSSKTTSVIGKYDPPGGPGTKNLIESGITKSGDNPAGVNVLNDLTNTQGWPPQQIWDDINQPWLDDAIARGDVIRAVSDPLNINNVFFNTSGIPTSVFSSPQSLANYLKNLSDPAIINQLSFYGREIRHLPQGDYLFDTATNLFLK